MGNLKFLLHLQDLSRGAFFAAAKMRSNVSRPATDLRRALWSATGAEP